MKRADSRSGGGRRGFGLGLGLLIAAAASGAALPADASPDRRVNVRVPSQRVDRALLDMAVQARVSLGGDLSACSGVTTAVNGTMTLDSALSRLLANSGCTHAISRTGVVIIRRAERTRPFVASRPPPAPAVVSPPPTELDLDEVYELSDVIVTAERRPDSPQTAAVAVTAVSGEQISAAGGADAHDLSNLIAGMTVTNLGSGRNKILLRGMSDGAFTGLTQSTVGLYLDLVPITYSAPDPDLKLLDVDRVEVLRGPQGALYGTGPIGGVVRIMTRRPDSLAPALDLSSTRSMTDGGGANTEYSAILNLPLPNEQGAIRGVAYEESFDGYIDDLSLSLRRVNAASRRGGRLAATVRLGSDWATTAGVVHQSIDTEDTHYVYRTLGGLRRANLVREPHANDFTEVHASIEGRGDWGRIDGSLAHIDHRFRSRFDASTALRLFGSTGRIGALDESKSIDVTLGELTFRSRPSNGLEWLVGGFFSTSETSSDTLLSAIRPVPGEVYGEHREDGLEEAALFGEISYDLRPNLTLTAGGRLYTFDYDTRSDVTQGDGNRQFQGRNRTLGFSPKLVLDYRPDEQVSVYAVVSQGHRVGGFNTAGPLSQTFMGGAASPTRDYEGDTLWNYEVGAKAMLWDGQVQTRVAAFVADWRNIQSDQFLPSGLAYAVNVGDGANRGIEIETNWKVSETFEIRTNALLANPRITQPSDSFNSRGDAGLPGVPAVSANMTMAWRRSVGWGLDGFVNGTLAYVGASRLTFDAERRYRMGDYVTGRVSTGLEAKDWAVIAFVENPLNITANTFSFGDPFRLPEALATTPLRPRTIGVTLRLSR